MFTSLTCSSNRAVKGEIVAFGLSIYKAGWENGEGVKAFSVIMKILDRLQGFSRQPSGMKEWALEPDGPP